MLKNRDTTLPPYLPTALITLLYLAAFSACRTEVASDDHRTWTHYGGSPDQSRYFSAQEITKENVHQLQVAWNYASGEDFFNFFSPIIVDTVMYVFGKNNSLIALNVVTGEEIWIHANLRGLTRRGLNYWESEDKTDRRLIFTLNNSLQAIDAATGKSITTFGADGYVDDPQG